LSFLGWSTHICASLKPYGCDLNLQQAMETLKSCLIWD
jgi:hypothetical protein